MTTTISVTAKRQVVLPKAMCARKNIKPGMSLRVTETPHGLYVSLVPEPAEAELKAVISAAGSLRHPQTPQEETMVLSEIAKYRAEKRRKGG